DLSRPGGLVRMVVLMAPARAALVQLVARGYGRGRQPRCLSAPGLLDNAVSGLLCPGGHQAAELHLAGGEPVRTADWPLPRPLASWGPASAGVDHAPVPGHSGAG